MTVKPPGGVVGAISPWNFPITLQSRKIAPALAAGCTIVCKPASQTPLCLVQLFEYLVEAGLPAGVGDFVIGAPPGNGGEVFGKPLCPENSFNGFDQGGEPLKRGLSRPGE